MRGIKSVIILIITSFMAIGLVGCSEKVLTKEEVKLKLEYDKKIMDMLKKSSEGFPNDSKKIFNETIKELEEDIESIFNHSKESSNLKLKDEIKKELKLFENAYSHLLENGEKLPSYVEFYDLESITEEQILAIKPIYEKNKKDIEKVLKEDIESIAKGSDGHTVLSAVTVQCEKYMNAYKRINKLYNLKSDEDYVKLYEEKIAVFKSAVDERYTLDNAEIGFLDVKTQGEREPIWEKAKLTVEDSVKSGKLSFPSSVMSNDIIIKKSGSIYIIKSYVEVTSDGVSEKKEFTVKLDITESYTMLISLHI